MHVRLLHVCPWFDSSSFLRGFSTCLINGTLVASKFCQSRMTILYPFIISDSVLERTWGKIAFCSLFQRTQCIMVGRDGKGEHVTARQPRIWPRGMLELCWATHCFQHRTHALFAARLCLLSAAASWPVLFSPFLAFVPALCSVLWVSLFLLGALPLPLSIPLLSPLEPDWSDRCLFSSQKHFFFLYVFSICGDACHSC